MNKLKTSQKKSLNRREFIKTTAAGVIGGSIIIPTIVPSTVFGASAPSNKINIAAVGLGRISRSHDMPETMKYDSARIIAVCDVDRKRLKEGKHYVEEYYAEKTGKKKLC